MVDENLNTEQRILEAAKTVFIRKGLDGARMQEIADEAGINKSLLHYYFRSKDKLFEVIFEEIVVTLFGSVAQALSGEGDIETKIKMFFDKYIGFIKANPFMPMFVMHTVMQNPNLLINAVRKMNIEPKKDILDQIQKEMDNGKIIKMRPEQLILNMVSMSIFPFLAKPVIMNILQIKKDSIFDVLMEERKQLLTDFVISAIKVK